MRRSTQTFEMTWPSQAVFEAAVTGVLVGLGNVNGGPIVTAVGLVLAAALRPSNMARANKVRTMEVWCSMAVRMDECIECSTSCIECVLMNEMRELRRTRDLCAGQHAKRWQLGCCSEVRCKSYVE